jgi:hypothetical protein
MRPLIVAHPGTFVTFDSLREAREQALKLSKGGKTYVIYELAELATIEPPPDVYDGLPVISFA